ncbi:MAG: hypothetical protein IKX00_04825 [Bacilli bacterium]|nr:hypothetical protein [Bacilli bacterium]
MFSILPKEEPDYKKRLTDLYTRCKLVLSDDLYFKKLQNYFITNNVLSINSNSISNKYDYNLKELQNFMQAVYIGLSHYCYISFGSNNYSELVDTNDTLLSWYYVKYKNNIYKISEIDGEDEFYHTCEIVKGEVNDNCLDLEEINNFYQTFEPTKPHEKVRSRNSKVDN